MQWFFERIHDSGRETHFVYQDSQKHTEDFKKLLSLGILKQSANIPEITCGVHTDEHVVKPIFQEDNTIVVICNGDTREVL